MVVSTTKRDFFLNEKGLTEILYIILKILPRFSFHSVICGHQKMTPQVVSSPFFRNTRPRSLDGKTSNDTPQMIVTFMTSYARVFLMSWGLLCVLRFPPWPGCLYCFQPGRQGRNPSILEYPVISQYTSFSGLLGGGHSLCRAIPGRSVPWQNRSLVSPNGPRCLEEFLVLSRALNESLDQNSLISGLSSVYPLMQVSGSTPVFSTVGSRAVA